MRGASGDGGEVDAGRTHGGESDYAALAAHAASRLDAAQEGGRARDLRVVVRCSVRAVGRTRRQAIDDLVATQQTEWPRSAERGDFRAADGGHVGRVPATRLVGAAATAVVDETLVLAAQRCLAHLLDAGTVPANRNLQDRFVTHCSMSTHS